MLMRADCTLIALGMLRAGQLSLGDEGDSFLYESSQAGEEVMAGSA